jgi:hypothetical protein
MHKMSMVVITLVFICSNGADAIGNIPNFFQHKVIITGKSGSIDITLPNLENGSFVDTGSFTGKFPTPDVEFPER